MIITSAILIKAIQFGVSIRVAYSFYQYANNKLKDRTIKKKETKIVKG